MAKQRRPKFLDLHYRQFKKMSKNHPLRGISGNPIRSATNAGEAAEDLTSAFWDYAYVGMLEWRWGLGAARKTFQSAQEVALLAAQSLTLYRDSPSFCLMFPFHTAVFFSHILTGEFDATLLELLPDFSIWESVFPLIWPSDVAHITALLKGKYPQGWSAFLKACQQETSWDLFSRSQQSYARIIVGSKTNEPEKIADEIRQTGALFEERASDSFYYDFPLLEGAGMGPRYILDYRLAVIARSCLSNGSLLQSLPPFVLPAPI
jgi:hypothetical protein